MLPALDGTFQKEGVRVISHTSTCVCVHGHLHSHLSVRPATPAQTSAPCSGQNTRRMLRCRSGHGVWGWPGSSVPCKGEMMGLQAAHTSLGKGPDGRADTLGRGGRYGTCGGSVPRHTVYDSLPQLVPSQRECVHQLPAAAGGTKVFFLFFSLFLENVRVWGGTEGEKENPK